MNNNFISQGLNLSLIGLVLVFASILLLILVIYLVDRLFRTKPDKEETKPAEAGLVEMKDQSGADIADGEVAAVIAAALIFFKDQEHVVDANLGCSLEEPPGSWWVSNRMGIRNATQR